MSGATFQAEIANGAAAAAVAAEHLVGDEQHVVTVADLADAAIVVGVRRDAGRRSADDRLGEERRDRVRPLEQDRAFEIVGAGEAAAARSRRTRSDTHRAARHAAPAAAVANRSAASSCGPRATSVASVTP